ncbi:helix-turn-helix domain-containing protein [Nocardioides vastitatis]|uniref:Helix-turn-helix domain-containing protein n=2 Tax=Nocardioides TaxID=1839 RepID=A0ABW0ZL67_9ACTN
MGDVIRFPARPTVPERSERPERREPRRAPEGEQPLWREAAGRVLRDERHRSERTLSDVASDAGISVQYLSEIERGLKEPSSEMLAAAAGALGLSLADLTAEVSRRLRGPVCLAA